MGMKRDTPFHNPSLPIEERLDWLMSEMTMEEKLQCFWSGTPEFERLGIHCVGVGGEAAHGVEARNDQNTLGGPDTTTSFPQPIGVSATWDPAVLKMAGAVVGTEARVLSHKHPGRGLSRWAPTVDLERDPRWGRNEEGYGEDPVLTGTMASAYVQGMQGDDPKYLRIAATLKHFYANNTEEGRVWKNSSIDPRNKYELYLEPFRRCIMDGGAEAAMAAYNKINGTPGMLNSDIQTILKDQYGLKHAVSDGFAMSLVASHHHYFGLDAETLAAAVKAGVDSMSESPKGVNPAAQEAYELGLLTEEDINRALKNMFRTRLRLGVYDEYPCNPYDNVTDADLLSEENAAICKEVSRESIVLLKNEEKMLPLGRDQIDDIALIGPLADMWYQDWYGGHAPYTTTLREGMQKLTGKDPAYANGMNYVTFRMNGKYIAIGEDQMVKLSDEPDIFMMEDWDEGSITFRSVRTGLFMTSQMSTKPGVTVEEGRIAVNKKYPFSWFVNEIFHVTDLGDGKIQLSDRFYIPVCFCEDNAFRAIKGEEAAVLEMQIVKNGVEEAAALAKEKKTVVLALGSNSMVNAKEEVDRKSIALPQVQQELLEAVYAANPNVILVLFSNYPYTVKCMEKKVPAVIWSATGSQDMGDAMAETLFGDNAPAGRLNMTWYKDDSQLPDINDYDIIKGKRTYRYFDGEVMYPFGHGLTYSEFEYTNLIAEVLDMVTLQVAFDVTNTGDTVSDEVVQVYATAPASRVKKPLKQLLAFDRLKEIAPGETCHVVFDIPVEELRFYDTISASLMVEAGDYEIKVGASSAVAAQCVTVKVPGRKTGTRDFSKKIRADHYDDYENMCLTEGHFKFTAVTPLDQSKPASLTFGDCVLPEEGKLYLHLKSVVGCKIKVLVNGQEITSWEGDTRTYEENPDPGKDPYKYEDDKKRIASWLPIYTDVAFDLGDVPKGEPVTLKIEVSGDLKLCYLQMRKPVIK